MGAVIGLRSAAAQPVAHDDQTDYAASQPNRCRRAKNRWASGTGCGGQGAVKPAAAGGGGPQGQALRRLARRRESEPTDNAVELVRYRLAKVGTDPVQPTLNMWPTCP